MLFKRHEHPKMRAMAQKVTHGGVFTAHLAYCGTVFIESHGTYGLMAGVLGIMILVNMFVGGGAE